MYRVLGVNDMANCCMLLWSIWKDSNTYMWGNNLTTIDHMVFQEGRFYLNGVDCKMLSEVWLCKGPKVKLYWIGLPIKMVS